MIKKNFSTNQTCEHCRNISPMEIAKEYTQVKDYEDQKSGLSWNAGNIYQILVCPACYNVTFRKYFWHDLAIDPSEIQFEILYPLTLLSG